MKWWKGMSSLERGEEMWDRAGAQSVADAVKSYGDVHEAAEAALEILQESNDFEYEGDPVLDIRRFLEHELDL